MSALPEPFRSGFVALAGRPNVGKSTLANALAGRHVAAVSPRPQTTRRRAHVVVHRPGWQAVLLDLPGFQRPADRLTARMQAAVDVSLADCDAAVFVLNAAEAVGAGDRFIGHRLAESGLPTIVVVNQVDRVAPATIAATIARGAGLVEFVAVHPVSALTGDGLEALAADLAGLLPEGPRYFPDGVSTDQTDEELAGELIREAALARVREEVPHSVAVQVEGIDPAHDGGRVITATILVERDSQKAIIVGRGGATIREIGTGGRELLARLWGVPVHLALTVKVRRRWRQDDRMLDRLGL